MKNLEKKARAYALKNAVAYDGVAREGPVISALFNEGLKPGEVKKHIKKITEIILEINSLSPEEQKKEFERLVSVVSERHGREGLPELPGVKGKKGKVIMRFAPSASGPYHIGHALTGSLSYLFVKKYGGKFYVRIEDTNPENIYPRAYKMIADESRWLFPGKFLKILIQSDRMKIYYACAENLLKKTVAYVCTCPQESFKELVDKKKNCPCRANSAKDNINRWKRMLGIKKPEFSEGGAILRFKSGMQDKNPAMRDFPLARINLEKHPRQGLKYRVWPLMNLAVAADDIDLKMTHIIRAKDHRDNAERQRRIYVALGLKAKVPWTGFLGRIHLKDMELSTSKMRKAIEAGDFSGWDDKRLPTIASIMKQGYKPEAFWKFAERIGLSENDKTMDRKEFFRLLDDFNR